MDSERDDTSDDDVTIVGDHELVVELRRIAAERGQGARALPPPAWPVSTGAGDPPPSASNEAPRPRSLAANRRPAPPAPAPRVVSDDEWWYDDDGATGSRFVWLGIASVVAALVVVGLILLR